MSCHVRKMRMMAAAGSGTCEPKTPVASELNAKLSQMQAERDKQDSMWTTEAKCNHYEPLENKSKVSLIDKQVNSNRGILPSKP